MFIMRFKRCYIVLLMLLMVFALAGNAHAAYNVNQYNRWANHSTDELMRRGQHFLQDLGQVDSAVVCYSIVAGRARENSEDSKAMCQIAKSMNNLGYIYATYYYDYQKAYECINNSLDIAKQYRFDDLSAYAYLNLASITENRNELYDDESMLTEALDNTKMAFAEAVKSNEWNVAVTCIYNMLEMMRGKKDMESIKPELDHFKRLQLTDSVEMWQCTRMFCQATEAYVSGQYAQALEFYNQMEIKAQEVTTNRLQCIIKAKQQKGIVLAAMKRYDEALACLYEVETITREQGMQSELINTYRTIAQVYTAMGNKHKADQFDYKYLKAKEEFIHKSHAVRLEKSRFLNEMRRVNEQVAQIRAKHERAHQLLLMMSLIAAIILTALVLLVRSYLKQRDYIRHLYEKNVQLLGTSETVSPSVPKENIPLDDSAPKYQGMLDQESKDRLFDQIKRVMEDMNIVCKPDFSLQSLAEEVGSNYKYVSQVVNECYGKSFKQVLNEQRVREACRMFNDTERYGNLTIEAIAANLGFNSRSNFTVTFKRITGISPSDFMKMAKGK